MRIVMMGPQGSGKGTQAKRLSEKLGIPHVSTGDLLREEMAAGSDIGKSISSIIQAGRLVPDEIILYMVEKRLSRDDCAGGFIADGFPRNLSQLLEIPMVWRVDRAVQLWIDTQTSVERIAMRINCPECKATYGPKNPPAQEGKCDRCGSALEQRQDDAKRGAVIQRLQLYWSEIAPVLEYFRSGGVLATLDGDQPIDTVYAQILAELGLSG